MSDNISFGVGILICMILPSILMGQSAVTFRVDMSPQMKDSTFIPSKHTVEIMGNQLPFTKVRPIQMMKRATTDSVYIAKVRFPSIVNGRELDFTYYINKAHQKIKDQAPRSLILDTKDKVLPIVRFNEFMR